MKTATNKKPEIWNIQYNTWNLKTGNMKHEIYKPEIWNLKYKTGNPQTEKENLIYKLGA